MSATVLALQEQLPKARIVYCSATGVSESLSPFLALKSGFRSLKHQIGLMYDMRSRANTPSEKHV